MPGKRGVELPPEDGEVALAPDEGPYIGGRRRHIHGRPHSRSDEAMGRLYTAPACHRAALDVAVEDATSARTEPRGKRG